MKTAKEIMAKIEVKNADENQVLAEWAIGLIDATSETMFSKGQSSLEIQGLGSTNTIQIDFATALRLEAVKKVLKENGFKITRPGHFHTMSIIKD